LYDWVECEVDGIPNHGKTERKTASHGANVGWENLNKKRYKNKTLLQWYLCSEKMKDRVDTKGMGDEHYDGNNQREEAKDTVSRDELFPPIGEAGKEEAADSEDDGATAVHIEPVTGTKGSG
jgi:hypothetical protein